MQNSRIKWEEYNITYIVGGKTNDNVRLLQLFLIDYKKEFNVTSVNPSCSKCLKGYLEQFKKKYTTMEKTQSQYRLKKRYQNIPLRNDGEGYNVMVNNNNLTDEYAEILLERYPKEKIFELFPDESFEVKEPKAKKNKKAEVVEQEVEQTTEETQE